MKNKKILIVFGILILIVVLIVFNIQFLLKLYLGMTDPKNEDKQSLYAYAEKINLSTNDFYVIDTSQLKEIYTGSFPKVYFFNEAGDLIISGNCFGALPELVDTLKSKKNFDIVKPNYLSEVLNKVKTFDGNPVTQLDVNSKFTIVFYWAKWMGKLNKTKLLALEQRIKELENQVDIRLIKINADFQSSWKLSEDELQQLIKR